MRVLFFSYETGNGISASEYGQLKPGGPEGIQTVYGSYSYPGEDGQLITVTYTADENGFVPKGNHLPTPPPTPAEILQSLEQNAAEEAAAQQAYQQQAAYGQNGGSAAQYGQESASYGQSSVAGSYAQTSAAGSYGQSSISGSYGQSSTSAPKPSAYQKPQGSAGYGAEQSSGSYGQSSGASSYGQPSGASSYGQASAASQSYKPQGYQGQAASAYKKPPSAPAY